MPYEDPIEAALRALTGVEWTKRKEGFETRVNKTTGNAITLELQDHKIQVVCEPSEAQTGRYIVKVPVSEVPFINRAMKVSGAEIKPHRRKRNT